MPDGTVVVRGGELLGPSREANERRVFETYGMHGICVKAEPGLTARETAVKGKLRNRTVMHASAGDLRSRGYAVIREPGKGWPNALLVFPAEPREDDWTQLRDVMRENEPISNPVYRGS